MMPPGSRASLADSFFVIGDDSWSSFLILFDAGSAQALAGEIDPVRIMDEAIKDRVGVRGIAYDFVPALHGELRGDDGRTAAVSFLEDFEDVVNRIAETHSGSPARKSDTFCSLWREDMRLRVLSQPVPPA